MAAFRGERDLVGRDDMVTLSNLTEAELVANLKKRYTSGIIYTSIGAVLISVNPYKDLDVFSKKNIDKYRGKQSFELPPHVFTLAEETYKALLTQLHNQCIIISGESGAGKTEASKGIMQYIAAVAGSGATVDKVKNIILESNPLLEAFGNAKTVRNNNSSRFGKYIEINFVRGDPVGGRITNYLLEKSRVIGQSQGERNFHIFYQLFTGSEKGALGLRNFEDYEYLKKSGSTTADGINDAHDFNSTKHAMKTVGIDGSEQNQVFQILAGILNLGNLNFKSAPQDSSIITDKNLTSTTAKLLGVPDHLIETALLTRSIASASARGTTYSIPSNPVQAAFSRDALAKGIYGRLFDWLVRRTNKSMLFTGANSHSIGILDIYGFEIFQLNSFEQLCINYVNETLHQIFIDLTLKAEQEEYVKEGIPWQQVNYYNNKPVVDFLAGRPLGLFNILDEECLFPQGTDQSYLTKMGNNFSRSDSFKLNGSAKGQSENFTIRHYAGEVTYSVKNFLEKNRDTLFEDLKNLCLCSSIPVLKTIFEEAMAAEPVLQVGGKGGKARPVTAGYQFRQSVAELLKALYACQPHYIRTIKPNDNKAALQFDDSRVTEQTRYLGLLENLHVRRAGFCYRSSYERWLKRYAVISDRTFPRWAGNPREGVEILLKEVGVNSKDYQFGKTKIFIREPQTLYTMEDGRLRALDKIALRVKGAKVQPKIVQGNILLEYLQLLIFEELEEFTVNRIPKRGGPIYQSVEGDYLTGAVDPTELKASLYQCLTDVVEPIREHFDTGKKSGGGGWFGFLKFFSKGKTQTSSLAPPGPR